MAGGKKGVCVCGAGGGGGLALCQKGFTEATSICDHAEAQGGERKLDLVFSGCAVWKSCALCCEFQKKKKTLETALLTDRKAVPYPS